MQGQREPVGQQPHAVSSPRLRWRRVFPGQPDQLRVLRHWLADLLPPCDARDMVIAVASELGANAVCHTASRQPGGTFSVEVEWGTEAVTVVVGDGGGRSAPRIIDDPAGENGRGLQMVYGLSAAVAVSGGEQGRYVRADVPWAANGGPAPLKTGWNRQAAADLADLQRRFPAAVIWLGHTTRQWWAMVAADGRDRLVAESSADELAAMLAAVYRAAPARGQVAGARQPVSAARSIPAGLARAATR